VIENEVPIAVKPGVELVGAPWTSKRPLVDLVARALAPLGTPQVGVRIAVAHGCVDTLSPDDGNPALISLAAAEGAITAGKLHYLALGDRHSLTDVGASGRVRYAGTPEATDYDEVAPGQVLVVELDAHEVKVEAVRTGTWRFLREKVQLSGAADLVLLQERLAGLEDKGHCIVKLDLEGTLTLSQKADLDSILEGARLTLGALEVSERGSDLKIVPDAVDFAGLGLSGFAERAVERLREQASGTGADALTARDALGLLLRLTKEAS
ncbi:MAG: exonuclease SbcCD subunit D, partial [Planctomycetota bacterium]